MEINKAKTFLSLFVALVFMVAGVALLVGSDSGSAPEAASTTPPQNQTDAPQTSAPVNTTVAATTTSAPEVTSAPESSDVSDNSGTDENGGENQPKSLTKTVELGQFTVANTGTGFHTQKGWTTEGSSTLTADDFRNAKYLVLEFEKLPEPDFYDFQFIWLSVDEGYYWAQDSKKAVKQEEPSTTLVIEIEKAAQWYEEFVTLENMTVYIGYYYTSWDDLPLKDAYLAID
ncbi:MAG: hypothetical protein FWG83_01750 [Oscillospiraceae bacterium]|nr:hypothetical protein [Oscillospiraceae bacterium]